MDIKISVRQLVEFILREGDIDNRRTGGAGVAMQEGSRIHRMIQRRMGSEYHAEVPLQIKVETGPYDIVLDGRADGIIDYDWEKHAGMDSQSQEGVSAIEEQQLVIEEELSSRKEGLVSEVQKDTEQSGKLVTIDEIKGTYKDLKKITKPIAVHLAQAKCYAYIYATQNHLFQINVRMTYCNLETEELKYFHESFTLGQLETWFRELMGAYKKWADFQFEWNQCRTDSIKQLEFPFSYRDGQRELVKYVYQTIYHGRKLFLEAPTGVGKTISTVFPAVKSMGEGLTERIFYLTAKTITRTVAQECFAMLSGNGLRMKTVVLTAKDKVCPMEERQCNPDACPYAKGFFDKINDAMYDMLLHEDNFSRDKVWEYSTKYQICPFEMSLEMSLFSDAIICDYNYVFDPNVYLRRFFLDNMGKRNYTFLIDETHNLLDRGREMYSAALIKEDFLKIKKLLKEQAPKTERLLEKCNRELLSMKRNCEDYQEEEMIDSFVATLTRAYAALDEFLEEHESFPEREEILAFFFSISHFLNIYEIMDENYIVYSQILEDGNFMLKLFCVNPSRNLKACMKKGRSTILFSATLLPIQYYKRLLGGEVEDYEVYAKSVFSEDRRALLLANDVTSKYTRRSDNEFRKIACYIYEVVRQRYGNYMVFLPSHAFLEQVYDSFMEEFFVPKVMECVVQEERMSEEQREEFLRRFQGTSSDVLEKITFEIEEQEETILIGFCVLGGIFSEGIDLKNDSLIGAMIVGTGIPQVGCERELLKKYFDEQGENGFDYAYRYPGMNKVLQAAGRVIRTVEDVGIIALLDERFLEYPYRKMFPREWSQFEIVDVNNVSKRVEKFWNEWL